MTNRSRITLFLAGLLAASSAAAGAITDVRFQNTGAAQAAVPVTFGQVFAVGDMKKTDILVGTLDGSKVPLQVDVKATHADGSVRHAIISAIVPKLAAGATGTMSMATGGTLINEGTKTPADLLATGFTASTSATIAGVKYSASADQLLKAAVKTTWLSGAFANEWQVSAPLTTAAGVAHPHLQARFAIRYYTAVKKARVDVTIENGWTFEPGPQNFTYDAEIQVGGKTVFSKAALTHYRQARWRKVFWWGGDAPAVNVQSNVPYLISSKAVPNYDQAPGVAESVLAGYTGAAIEPMGIGWATGYMPTTGAHADIGLLPKWTVEYILTQDQRARDVTLSNADGAGSFSTHFRDRVTDRPVSIVNYPFMTQLGNRGDTKNPNTGLYEEFPGWTNETGATPFTPDTSHQPGFAYFPYVATGDYFYLEELQFWTMWNLFNDNPNYRQWDKGLLNPGQVRGQAWSMRTLAEAAYITPDDDILKKQFMTFMDNNLAWYNATYSNNATANKLGAIVNGYAYSYNGDTAIAPWQDDFFTQSIGHVAELGFDKAKPLLAWKSKFPVGRMVAPGVCWLDAAIYNLTLRPTKTSPVYETFAEVYQATRGGEFMSWSCGGPEMQKMLQSKPNDMGQLSDYVMGYPSNMQPALAYAVDSGIDGSKKAWDLFSSRSVQPDYSKGGHFNVLPRTYVSSVKPIIVAPTAPAATATLTASPTANGTWAKIGAENAQITVPADTIVRYGAGTAWIYAKASGSFFASNTYFGKDPAVNTVKTVEAFTPAAVASPVVVPPVVTPPVVTPPATVKPGKVTTPGNVKLKKLTGLTLTFFDAATFAPAKVLTGLTPNSAGTITISDIALVPAAIYGVRVTDTSGKVIDVMYPITAN